MASIKSIKDDIHYLTEQVIIDALEFSTLYPQQDGGKIVEIINEIILLHDNMILKVNKAPKSKIAKEVKAYFKSIAEEMLKGCDDAYGKISVLLPK